MRVPNFFWKGGFWALFSREDFPSKPEEGGKKSIIPKTKIGGISLSRDGGGGGGAGDGERPWVSPVTYMHS